MKQETLEEVALRIYQYVSENPPYTTITPKDKIEGFIEGAQWQAERMYSEEELRKAMNWMLTQYFEFYECPTTGRIRMDYYVQSIKQQIR